MATSTSGITANSNLTNYLQLLTAQLKNQDPLQPMNNSDLSTQLAQFSQLQGMQQLNASFADLLSLQQLTQGANLVGKSVAYQKSGSQALSHGTVDSVSVVGGKIQLMIGGNAVALTDVRGFEQAGGGGSSHNSKT